MNKHILKIYLKFFKKLNASPTTFYSNLYNRLYLTEIDNIDISFLCELPLDL